MDIVITFTKYTATHHHLDSNQIHHHLAHVAHTITQLSRDLALHILQVHPLLESPDDSGLAPGSGGDRRHSSVANDERPHRTDEADHDPLLHLTHTHTHTHTPQQPLCLVHHLSKALHSLTLHSPPATHSFTHPKGERGEEGEEVDHVLSSGELVSSFNQPLVDQIDGDQQQE